MLRKKTVESVLSAFAKSIGDLEDLHTGYRAAAELQEQKSADAAIQASQLNSEADRAIRLKFRLEELLEG